MDELDVGGKKYISSKRASELTGYAKDYIGQLLRAKKVSGTRFGRAWYVEESEILRHAGKTAIPDVPATAFPPEPQEEVSVVTAKKIQGKPLLTHHMITPAVLPKTWSNIQYLEDTSDLYPVVTPRAAAAAPEKKTETNTVPESAVPVSITRTRASVEKRVATLVDGIRPRSAMLRVAATSPAPVQRASPKLQMGNDVALFKPLPQTSPEKQTITKESKAPLAAPKRVSVRWSPGSFATIAAVFIFVFGSFASFFFIQNASLGNSEALTASSFYGLTDFLDLLKEARILENGLDAIRNFYRLLSDSFLVFLKSGSDFILGLF